MNTFRVSPDTITELPPNGVFVFGSNTKGIHKKGAALVALNQFGAILGQAEGFQGQSYAIVTKNLSIGDRSVALESIGLEILKFIVFAEGRKDLDFYVTQIGCGYAGYSVEEIAVLFQGFNLPFNVLLPQAFIDVQDKIMVGSRVRVTTEQWKDVSAEDNDFIVTDIRSEDDVSLRSFKKKWDGVVVNVDDKGNPIDHQAALNDLELNLHPPTPNFYVTDDQDKVDYVVTDFNQGVNRFNLGGECPPQDSAVQLGWIAGQAQKEQLERWESDAKRRYANVTADVEEFEPA